MTEVDAQVAPEAAVSTEAVPVEIPRRGTEDYAKWRFDGTLPDRSKVANNAGPPSADNPKEETSVIEPAPEPGTKQQESRRKPDAESRIRELNERARQLERELEEARKPKEAITTPPVRRNDANPRPKPDDANADGTPRFKDYGEYEDALVDWKLDQRERAQAQARRLESAKQQLLEAQTRYEDYNSKALPVVQQLLQPDISPVVFEAMEDSPVLAELLYTIGGTEQSKADFLKAARENPSKALRVALLMEQEIVKAMSGTAKVSSSEPERDDKGKFVPAAAKSEHSAPAKRGPESAPAPPLEVGSRGSVTDDSERLQRAIESGDSKAFGAWKRNEDAKEIRKRRGA